MATEPEHRAEAVRLVIGATWDGVPVSGDEVAVVTIRAAPGGLRVEVEAPFHGDPPPTTLPGSTDRLWEHEVVELFVAGPGDRYLEVELGPHGHYLVLQLDGVRRRAGPPLELEHGAEARVEAGRWRSAVLLPSRLLPPGPHRVNAYALHGAAPRRYLAHAPVPGPAPDFHRLERFAPMALPGGGGGGGNFRAPGDTEVR